MKVSIVIPTYNERDNLQELVERIFAAFRDAGVDGEIIIVDDNSPDGTSDKASELSKEFDIVLLKRSSRQGLSSAAIVGFGLASGEVIGVMDADLSHDPESIKPLLDPLIDGTADMTVGSRYVDGGSIDSKWPLSRRIISKAAILMANPLTDLRDSMSGFFFLRNEVLKKGQHLLDPYGQKIILDIVAKCRPERILEIPISFRQRRQGKSKMSFREVRRYIAQLWRLYNSTGATPARYVKFMVIGAIGMIINFIIFWALTSFQPELFLYDNRFLFAAFIAFMVAVTNNFLLCNYWPFRDRRGIIHIQYFQFIIASLGGLAINEVALKLMVDSGLHHLPSQFFGILLGSFFNFFINLKWTFSLRAAQNGPVRKADKSLSSRRLGDDRLR